MIRGFLSLLALLIWAPAQYAAEPLRPRPNVLWISADDHAPYVMGAYGNRRARTPNLDRLAARGLRFDRAYCNSPVCTASRQSFLTGRYPRTIGVTQLRTALPESEVTLADVLKAQGYATAAIGKMHFNSNLKHGFDLRVDLPQHRQWLQARGSKVVEDGINAQGPWRPFNDPASIWLNSATLPYGLPQEEMTGTFFAAEAGRFLAQARQQPFFLMVSFYEPHSPFHFPREFRGRWSATEFQPPRVGPEDVPQIPAIFRELSDDQKRGITAAYYTSVEFMDENVGRVLKALDASGAAGNTIIIYTGDHGYNLGHHGRFEKHCGYEPAVRAPLLISFPPRIKSGTSSSALVELLDVFPTVLELAGVSIPPGVQGRSLVPVLTGKRRQHRERVFVEYSENEEAYVITDRWKFIYSTGKRTREDGYATGLPLPGRTLQLFDLRNDPDEFVNLAGKRQHAKRVTEFTRTLADHMRRTAREPAQAPLTQDPHTLLEFFLPPGDLPALAR